MNSSSVNKIIEVLEELDLISDEYKKGVQSNITADLLLYGKGILIDNIPDIANSLTKYSLSPQLLGRFDLPFLTLPNAYVTKYEEIFSKLDNEIRVKQLGHFKENPFGLFDRLEFCVDNGVPYKDASNVLFKEVNFCVESGSYLRAMVLSELPKYELNALQKSIFNKVCGVFQTRTYEVMNEKLPITDNLAETIIEEVKSDPSLTEDDVEFVVKKVAKRLPYLNIITQNDNSYLNDEYSSIYPRNGRR